MSDPLVDEWTAAWNEAADAFHAVAVTAQPSGLLSDTAERIYELAAALNRVGDAVHRLNAARSSYP